jgi:hypothetical protein
MNTIARCVKKTIRVVYRMLQMVSIRHYYDVTRLLLETTPQKEAPPGHRAKRGWFIFVGEALVASR